MKQEKNYLIKIVLILIILTISVSSFILFRNYFNFRGNYIISEEEKYFSDFTQHLYMARNGVSYSLLGVFLIVIDKLFNNMSALAVFMSALLIFSIYVEYIFIKFMLKRLNSNISNLLALTISISLTFICSIYIPFVYPNFYNYFTLSTQPWHNPTYLLMKPLAIIVLLFYFHTFENYQSKISLSKYLLFAFVIMLLNFTKPNFIIAFGAYLFFVCLLDLFKTRGKSFVPAVKLGFVLFISLLPILYQSRVLFANVQGASIIITLQRFKDIENIKNGTLALFAGMIFPVYVSILLFKNKKNSMLNAAWMLFIISYIQRLFFAETGPRAQDGNFVWGAFFFAFFLYMVCIVLWIDSYKKGIIKNKLAFVIGNLLYGASVLSGVVYYILLLQGRPFFLYF